jgi:hypothetical protein
MLMTMAERSASTDDTRLASSNSVCSLHYGSFHGVPAAGRPKALSKHASLYVRGQVRSCTSHCFYMAKITL